MKTQIDIPVSELKSALPGLAKIAGRSRTLRVPGCVRATVGTDGGILTLQANNLEEFASVRISLERTQTSGDLLIPLETLSGLVKCCPGDQFIRVVSEEKEARVMYSVAGSTIERLVDHVPLDQWPEQRVIKGDPFEVEEGFKVALKEALECAADDPGRTALQGACLDLQKDGHYIVGTDGRHLYSANTFRFSLPESVIVPRTKFVCWPAFMNDGVWKLRMGIPSSGAKRAKTVDEPAWVQIDSDRWTYTAKAIAGNYPNWKQVVPPEDSAATRVEFGEVAVEAMLDAIPLLPGSDLSDQPVAIEAGEKGIVLHVHGRERNDQTHVPIEGVQVFGKPVQISLNRQYLLKALRFGFASLQIQDELTAMRFSQTGKVMVIMPLRPSGPAAATPAQPAAAPPTEKASDVTPSVSGAETQTDERNEPVVTGSTSTIATARSNGHTQNVNGSAEERSAFKGAVDQIDQIKAKLKAVMADLTEAAGMLKAAEKEQRLNLKEVETVRAKLREIQSVSI